MYDLYLKHLSKTQDSSTADDAAKLSGGGGVPRITEFLETFRRPTKPREPPAAVAANVSKQSGSAQSQTSQQTAKSMFSNATSGVSSMIPSQAKRKRTATPKVGEQ